METKKEAMFKRYVEVECELIKMQVGIDNENVQRWINDNAVSFSEKWQICLCKYCVNYKKCGYLMVEDCSSHIPLKD